MKFFDDFPHSYDIAFPTDLPGSATGQRVFHYPGANESYGTDGCLVQFSSTEFSPWYGIFSWIELNFHANGVYSCPKSDYACVVSSGAAYIVNSKNPKDWIEVPCHPVCDVKQLREEELLLFVDFTEIVAWSSSGIKWVTKCLALDEISITKVERGTIYGVSNCYCREGSGEHAFTVDIESGRHTGGSHV